MMEKFEAPRCSGRYPWARKRYMFADWDQIRRSMIVEDDIDFHNRRFFYTDGHLNVMHTVPFDAIASAMERGEINKIYDFVANDIAKKYDEAKIREVFGMDSRQYDELKKKIVYELGGTLEMEVESGCHDVVPCAHVKIDIPARHLNELVKGLVSPAKAPKIERLSIRRIDSYNDRAVVCRFSDGSSTKCVCGKDETFNLYTGIAFCLFKRTLDKENGHRMFNDLMRNAYHVMDMQKKLEEMEASEKEARKAKQKKWKEAHERKLAKKRQEKIDMFVEALRKNREVMMEEGWEPMVKPDKPNPYIAPGEPEPPVKPDEKYSSIH